MLELTPMTQTEFETYLAHAVKTYADEKVEAGNWQLEGALARAEDEFHSLLPEGLASKNHHLFSVKDAGKTVGTIWFGVTTWAGQQAAFIYDFAVAEAFQGRGYGKGAMLAVEEKAKVLGLETVSLHVFGHNRVARSLYEKLGYEVTNVHMTKRLENSAQNSEP